MEVGDSESILELFSLDSMGETDGQGETELDLEDEVWQRDNAAIVGNGDKEEVEKKKKVRNRLVISDRKLCDD